MLTTSDSSGQHVGIDHMLCGFSGTRNEPGHAMRSSVRIRTEATGRAVLPTHDDVPSLSIGSDSDPMVRVRAGSSQDRPRHQYCAPVQLVPQSPGLCNSGLRRVRNRQAVSPGSGVVQRNHIHSAHWRAFQCNTHVASRLEARAWLCWRSNICCYDKDVAARTPCSLCQIL